MEKVALKEAEAEHEKKKMDERVKELKKEREREELVRLGQSSGKQEEEEEALDREGGASKHSFRHSSSVCF